MPAIIRFLNIPAFESQNEQVIKVLEENDIPQGSYIATKTFPPFYLVPEVESESHPSVSRLRELDDVIVEIQTDDD